MSSPVAAAQAGAARAVWWRSLTWRVVLLYALTRLVSGVFLAVTAPEQLPAGMTDGVRVGYFGFTRIWDGEWYERVAVHGYPQELPTNASGRVSQNQWAFYPLFPMLSRLLMELTGLSFAVVASTTALLLGFAAAIVMAKLLAERIGETAALAVVGLYAVFPAAPALQVAYTESLAMLLLCGYLWALSRERWLVATGLALLIGLARPIALPLGVVTLVAVALRWRRRRTEPVGRREAWSALAALVGCAVAGLLWPVTAWIGTGRLTAYTDTMGAWSPGGQVRWFTPWITTTGWYLGTTGYVLLAGLLVAMLAMSAGPWSRALGPELRIWPLAYAAYVMAAQGPGTSTPRYLLMMFPYLAVLIGAGWVTRPRPPLVPMWPRVAVLAAVFLYLQWKWVTVLWLFTPPTDWAP
jgi:hypothetical protein